MKAVPISEYHEDMGDVLWWKFPIMEVPYVGQPSDIGQQVLIDTCLYVQRNGNTVRAQDGTLRADIGGWPGYHTHFTPLEIPDAPPDGKAQP